MNDEPPTDEEAREAHRQWVAQQRYIRTRAITWAAIYFLLGIALSIVLAFTRNLWWNIPGLLSTYTGVYYFLVAFKRRKI